MLEIIIDTYQTVIPRNVGWPKFSLSIFWEFTMINILNFQPELLWQILISERAIDVRRKVFDPLLKFNHCFNG